MITHEEIGEPSRRDLELMTIAALCTLTHQDLVKLGLTGDDSISKALQIAADLANDELIDLYAQVEAYKKAVNAKKA